jgi:hypothetical protein
MNYRPFFVAGGPRDIGDLAHHLVALARQVKTHREPLVPVGRWRCLRAGADTPLWNALAWSVAARLRRRGAKARLARLLGISRQRLHLLVVARTACPDAERTLWLLLWLHAGVRNDPGPRPPRVRRTRMSSIK